MEARNGLEEEQLVGGIQYLVLGHFEEDERDVKGYDGTRWLNMAELDALEPSVVAAALDAWEGDSARLRRRATTCDRSSDAVEVP